MAHADEAIRAAVEAELEWMPTASRVHIGVSVNNGVVELSGEVDTLTLTLAIDTNTDIGTGPIPDPVTEPAGTSPR